MGTEGPDDTYARNMAFLASILHPHYCRDIGCPALTDRKCEECRLREIISCPDEGKKYRKNTATIEYDPKGIPCPLEELAALSYKDWISLSNQQFKRYADRAIVLLVNEHQKGMFQEPEIHIYGLDEDGDVEFGITRYRDTDCNYNRVAAKIYKKMGDLVPKAQIYERECSHNSGTSVTRSISYLTDARIQFLKEIELICRDRWTEERVRRKAQLLSDEYAERKKKQEEERKIRMMRIKEKEDRITRQCEAANERYGTHFYYHDMLGKVCIEYASPQDAEAYRTRHKDINERLRRIKDYDWILIKTYSLSAGVFGMCRSLEEFKRTYPDLWFARSMGKWEGCLSSTAILVASVPCLYEDFVRVTDNYAEVLKEEESKRKERAEYLKPIIDRTKLP